MGNSEDKLKFLYVEYEESYKQLRYYDDRQSSLLKYVGTISSAVATALLALLKLFIEDMDLFFIFQSGVCLIIFIVIFIILFIMARNRTYFVRVARQLNALRAFLLKNPKTIFDNNQMYTDTKLPAFRPLSTQVLMIFAVAFISAIYFAAFTYSYRIITCNTYDSSFAINAGLIVLAIEAILIIGFLLYKDRKKPDDAPDPGQPEKEADSSAK